MGPDDQVRRFPPREPRDQPVDAAPEQEDHEAVHRQVGVGDRDVREVPDAVQGAKRLERPLRRPQEVADHADEEERQRVAAADRRPASAQRQKEVARPADHGDEHAHAEDDRHGLQPPRNGAEDEMVRTDHRVEAHLRPERQHAEGVGVDRLVEQLGQKVVGQPQRERREPHPHTLMHVVALDHRVAEAMLIPGEVSQKHQHSGRDERPEDVPVREVDLLRGPLRDRPVQVEQQ